MAPIVRLLPFAVADGRHQMAADEVMLESAVTGLASMRFYRWDPPTASLGYFQRHEERLRYPELARMAWVRRPTGGGAIDHTGDLTYALAIPAGLRQGRTPAAWHDHLHQLLVEWLRGQQVGANVATGSRLPAAELGYRCFAVPQPGDVTVAGRKVIGGAQRVRAGAILQHGSIQLPAVVGQADALARALARSLQWDLVSGCWTAAELSRIEELVREKYGSDAWNRKR